MAFFEKSVLLENGAAGIKQLPHPSKIVSFSGNLKPSWKLHWKILTGFRNTNLYSQKSLKKHDFIRKMALKNNFPLQTFVFLKPVNIFKWNFQEGFLFEAPWNWRYFGWAWKLFKACHAHFPKTLLFQKMSQKS